MKEGDGVRKPSERHFYGCVRVRVEGVVRRYDGSLWMFCISCLASIQPFSPFALVSEALDKGEIEQIGAPPYLYCVKSRGAHDSRITHRS